MSLQSSPLQPPRTRGAVKAASKGRHLLAKKETSAEKHQRRQKHEIEDLRTRLQTQTELAQRYYNDLSKLGLLFKTIREEWNVTINNYEQRLHNYYHWLISTRQELTFHENKVDIDVLYKCIEPHFWDNDDADNDDNDDPELCTICQDTITDKTPAGIMTCCKQPVHYVCLARLCRKQCALCNSSFVKE